MTVAERAEHIARDTILKLLSDEENAKVSSAEGSAVLAQGEEYVDLEHLDRGIQRADAAMIKGLLGILSLDAPYAAKPGARSLPNWQAERDSASRPARTAKTSEPRQRAEAP